MEDMKPNNEIEIDGNTFIKVPEPKFNIDGISIDYCTGCCFYDHPDNGFGCMRPKSYEPLLKGCSTEKIIYELKE